MNHLPLLPLLLLTVAVFAAGGQPFKPNYDEAKVPKYSLPDPLILADGSRVADAKTWESRRRPEILGQYEKFVYGKAPARPKGMSFEVRSIDKHALGGKAIRKEVVVYFTADKKGPKMDILIYLPANAKGKVPLFVGLNFGGNQTVHADPGITVTSSWVPNNPQLGIKDHRATDKTRGSAATNWPVEEILAKGYGLATIVEILSGLLTGLGYGVEPTGRHNDGCFIAVFNVAAFRDLNTFKQEVTEFAQYLKATPPAKGFTEVLYPGEIEFHREQDRRKNGIPVEDATWKRLQDLAQSYGMAGKLGL